MIQKVGLDFLRQIGVFELRNCARDKAKRSTRDGNASSSLDQGAVQGGDLDSESKCIMCMSVIEGTLASGGLPHFS